MQQSPLWDRWGVRHVVTHRNGSVVSRIVTFAGGTGSFLWQLLVHRPRVVHLHMASYGSFARKSLLGWIARLARVPVVVHVHGAEFHQFFERSPRPLRAYIRATLDHASAVVALGDTWAQRLEKIAPGARVVVVPNSVTPHSPVQQPVPGDPVQVLFLGEIGDRKGAFALLNAWKRLYDESDGLPGARLVLAGDGDVSRARERVDELGLQDQVRVTGWISPGQVQELLRTSQVLVLPSRNEGQPMAVLEAMANGLCVIVSDVGGLPDLVDADCGVLVAVDDANALVASLRHVISDHRERARLGANALRRVTERFDVDVTWRALDALYQELAR
jgi:glycosyltransferase involved in cell wall biosynthesis